MSEAAHGQDGAPAPMNAADRPAVLALLAACDLPVEDVREAPGTTQFVLREGGAVIATVGVDLEPGGASACAGAHAAPFALLRSLAVAPGRRGRGLGRVLVQAAEAHAAASGARTVVLLTATAGGLFAGLGYHEASRCALGDHVAGFRQFAAACCAGAGCYVKYLGEEPS